MSNGQIDHILIYFKIIIINTDNNFCFTFCIIYFSIICLIKFLVYVLLKYMI